MMNQLKLVCLTKWEEINHGYGTLDYWNSLENYELLLGTLVGEPLNAQ